MKVGITVIAYNQATILKRLVETALATTKHNVRFFVFAHTQAILPICEEIVALSPPKTVTVWPYGTNRGVARSWNDGLVHMQEEEMDVMLLCNDDMWVAEGDIDNIAESAFAQRGKWAIFCRGWQESQRADLGMACIAINPIAIETVGMFDVNFIPAYNEDTDYVYRAETLAGLERSYIDTNVHHIGSATIKTNPLLRQQNHGTHNLNDKYYLTKWGGPKYKEVYAIPFLDRTFHPYYISPAERETPYPGYNRTDQNIVGL